MKTIREISKKSFFVSLVFLLLFVIVGRVTAQTWTNSSPTGGPPAGRIGPVAVYNQANNRMVVFGGVDQMAAGFGVEFNDVWVLSNADGTGGSSSWTQLFPTVLRLPSISRSLGS